ncbi:hypothetical protein MCOR08_007233 [Pyricularia oryzae]|nr:hypothetical protein MCOR08_007233 [Pyricularia oryzae]
MRGYVDKLFAGLRNASRNENGLHPVERTSWLIWLTFDVVGDLALDTFSIRDTKVWTFGYSDANSKLPNGKPAEQLSRNPESLNRLKNEIRSAYEGEADIGLVNTQGLKDVNAVVNESLRIHTPVSGSGPRIAALSGTTIIGHYIPENTSVGINIWAVHHDLNSFTLPESFVPERWSGDRRFANDELDAVESFSTWPRNFLGKKEAGIGAGSLPSRESAQAKNQVAYRSLACAQIRMVLARLVCNFDLRIFHDKDWVVDQKAFTFWDKPQLRV